MTIETPAPEAVEVPSTAEIPAADISETPSEPAPEEPAPAAEDEEAKRSRGIERRINRLARERAEARAEADVLRSYLAQAQANQGSGYDPQADVPLTRAEMEAEFNRRQAVQVETERASRVGKKIQEAMRTDKEFQDAVANADVEYNPQQLAIMREMLDESENAVEIMRYLAKNPDEADRLAEYSSTKFARELGRLEDKVANLARPKQSNAPKPLEPVRTTSASTKDYRPDMSNAEFAAWRREQIRKRG